jgi:hypothetical protein
MKRTVNVAAFSEVTPLLRKMGVLACAGMVAAAAVPAASGGWVEVRTANVVVVSNARPEVAQQVATRLAQVREVLQGVLGASVTEPGEPVVVLAVNGEKALKELLPQFWERRGVRPVAATSPGPYTPYIALRTDLSAGMRQRVLQHEYVHIITRGTIPDVPAWLDEGLSDFWGSLRVQDGMVEVGVAPPGYVRRLRSRDWIPLAELVAIERGRYGTSSRRAQMVYAQSWALVHYLLMRPEAGTREPGVGSAPVFAPTLPADLATLERELKAYVRAGRLPERRLAPGPKPQALSPRVRNLPDPEALAFRASYLVYGERPAAALPLLNAALAQSPDEPLALEAMGFYHFRQNEPDLARRWFQRAVDAGPASYRAHYYYAVLMSAEPQVADRHLRRTLELNPGFGPALERLRPRGLR